MKKKYRNFQVNYGYQNLKAYKALPSEQRQNFLKDLENFALHPLINCDNRWILFFDDMNEKDFFQTLAKQDVVGAFSSCLAQLNSNLKTAKERLETYKASKNEAKIRKYDRKIANLLSEKEILLAETEKCMQGKQIHIAIDANNICEKYINSLIRLCDKLYRQGYHEIKILVASSDKSVDSKIEYYYTGRELDQLSKLQEKLDFYNKNNGEKCQLRFCELLQVPNSSQEYQSLWTLKSVKKANEFVEEIRITAENKKLSPLEAALFAYLKIAGSFFYKDGGLYDEGEQTMIGAFSEKEVVSCAGFSSLFKIAIDVLGKDNLSSHFVATENFFNGHCFNILKIIDPAYKIKGFYAVDALKDAKETKNSTATGFSGFLSRFNDSLYSPDSFWSLIMPNSRIDQICYSFSSSLKTHTHQARNLPSGKLKSFVDQKLSEKDEFVSLYDDSCNPVHYKTILSAYLNMANKIGFAVDFQHLAAMVTRTCIDCLLSAPCNSVSPWLELLNIEKIKEDFETKEKDDFSQSEIDQHVKKKNLEPLFEFYSTDNLYEKICQAKDNEKYFSKKYFETLEKLKQLTTQLNHEIQR